MPSYRTELADMKARIGGIEMKLDEILEHVRPKKCGSLHFVTKGEEESK